MNIASDDWKTPGAENDIKVNGRFKIKMTAKDKSAGLDFEGTYKKIKKMNLLSI